MSDDDRWSELPRRGSSGEPAGGERPGGTSSVPSFCSPRSISSESTRIAGIRSRVGTDLGIVTTRALEESLQAGLRASSMASRVGRRRTDCSGVARGPFESALERREPRCHRAEQDRRPSPATARTRPGSTLRTREASGDPPDPIAWSHPAVTPVGDGARRPAPALRRKQPLPRRSRAAGRTFRGLSGSGVPGVDSPLRGPRHLDLGLHACRLPVPPLFAGVVRRWCRRRGAARRCHRCHRSVGRRRVSVPGVTSTSPLQSSVADDVVVQVHCADRSQGSTPQRRCGRSS